MELSDSRLRELAHEGARIVFARNAREQQDLLARFPDLAPRQTRQHASGGNGAPRGVAHDRPRRHKMSAAERKAVSTRMKAYWASRRREKGKS